MYHLAQAKALMMRCEGMLEALSFLAQQFRIYEAHYAAKGDQEKANNNAEFARFAEKVIEGGTGGVWQGLLSQTEVEDIKKSVQGTIRQSNLNIIQLFYTTKGYIKFFSLPVLLQTIRKTESVVEFKPLKDVQSPAE